VRKKCIFIGIIFGLLFPISVSALSGSASISCNSTLFEVGSSTSCTLYGYSNEGVSAVAASLTAGGSISVSNINTSSNWQGNGSDGNIQLYTDSNKSGSFGIVSFTVTGNSVGSGTINVGGIRFSDASFNENGISGTSLSITVNEKYVPKPDPTPTTPSTVTTPGNNSGSNSNNNVTDNKKSNDASLKSLVIKGVNFEFSKDKLEYDVEVSNNVDKLDITAEVNNDKAKVTIPSDLSLKVGNNSFTIVVEAEDGTKSEYKINVKRLDRVLSSNTNLSKLVINGYNISFSKDKYIYDLGNIKSNKLNIIATSEDALSKVKIYGNSDIGRNDVIVIKVVAEDSSSKEYILYANNTKSSNVKNVLLICFLVALIASLVVNFILIFKKRKANNIQEVL
jgi:lipoprotein